jgi:hypothetical protein
VAAITEFDDIAAYRGALCGSRSDVEGVGNFLVRQPASGTRH